MATIIYEDNDAVVEVAELRESISGKIVNAATVTAQIFKDGVDISGTISMPYISGTRGTYRGVITDTLDMADGDTVVLIVSMDYNGSHNEYEKTIKVRKREP